MNKQAALAAGEPLYAIHRCHQPHANDDLDTLRRIEQGDSRLFARYPALQAVQVVHDPELLTGGETLLLGFHGLPSDTREELVGRGSPSRAINVPLLPD